MTTRIYNPNLSRTWFFFAVHFALIVYVVHDAKKLVLIDIFCSFTVKHNKELWKNYSEDPNTNRLWWTWYCCPDERNMLVGRTTRSNSKKHVRTPSLSSPLSLFCCYMLLNHVV